MNIDKRFAELKRRKEKLLAMDKLQQEVEALEFKLGVSKNQSEVKAIASVVCRHYGLTFDQLTSRCRSETRATARMIVWLLARRLTQVTFFNLARLFGKDHGTIISGVRRISGLIDVDQKLRGKVERIQNECLSVLEPVNMTVDNGDPPAKLPENGSSAHNDHKAVAAAKEAAPKSGPLSSVGQPPTTGPAVHAHCLRTYRRASAAGNGR